MKNNPSLGFHFDESIKTKIKFRLHVFLFIALLQTISPSYSQDLEIEVQFKKITPQEEIKLKAILDEPLRTDTLTTNLEKQVNEKRMAAKRLGRPEIEERVINEALPFIKNTGIRNDLARMYRDRGEYETAVSMHREVLELAPPVWKPFFAAHIANDFIQWGKYAEAKKELDKLPPLLEALSKERLGKGGQRNALRSTHFSFFVRSLYEMRIGKLQESIESAITAEQAARQAYAIQLPGEDGFSRINLAADVGNALARKAQAFRAAGKFYEAEQSLREYLRFASEAELPARFRAGIYNVASNLRFAQREFDASEKFARVSDDILNNLDLAPLSPSRANKRRDIYIALAGQKKWPQALAELTQLDQLAQGNEGAIKRIAFNFDRAYVYLGNQMPEQAAPLFAKVAASNLNLFGEGHFYVAQSLGLQGVALWRQGTSESKANSLKLLQSAVNDLIHPRNADYLDQFGIRPDIRQMIIGTYIECISELDPSRVLHALGLADWLRAGSVQEALSDAALRAAANTQGLSELVRKEQDAKNEIKGLRAFLQGDAGDAQSTLPDIAAQIRSRINSLEKDRSQFQAQIKAGFPDYERLVRPLPPSLEDISLRLMPDEAMLVLMPDTTGTNVWAVKKENGQVQAKFHRATINANQLTRTVTTLRKSLESIATQGRTTKYDDSLAYQTYQALIEPLGDVLNDRNQWIVAASGALARLPFAVLQTENPSKVAKPAWLISKASLTQVPSVSAWLSLRSLPRRQLPAQALLAWGDPVFDPGLGKSEVAGAVRNVNFTRAVNNDLDKDLPSGDKIYHSIPALPETRDELNDLAKALQADPQRDLILGTKATKQSVMKANSDGLLAQKKVIVFATHGLMAGDLPHLLQPALALAADGSESRNALGPLLTLDDVLSLKLNADWVVLSACNTAAADGKAEEALSGLARGFFYAGSRSMLVTHWAVESESAKELTTKTFAHFTANPTAPKAESLRSAILQVMADPKFGHPAFWAPYVLVGDSKR